MNYLEAVQGQRSQTATTEEVIEQPASTEVQSTKVPNKGQQEVTEVEVSHQVTPVNEDEIIGRLTGGAVTSVKDFTDNFPKWKEASQRGEVDEGAIMEKAFANSFVKEINEMVRNNATSEQIQMHVELSQLGDISKLDNVEAIARKIAIEEGVPLATAKKIANSDVKTLEDFLEDHEESKAEVLYEKYKIEQRRVANGAREYLKTKQKDIYEGVVSKADVQKQSQERATSIANQWTSNAESLKNTFKNLSVSKVEVKDEKAGMDYSFDINIPDEYIAKILPQVPKFASERGIELNNENIQAVSKEVLNSYIAENFSTIIEKAIRDTHANAIKKEVERNSNPGKISNPAHHEVSKKSPTDPTHPSNIYR